MELSAAEVWSRILESARTVLPDQAYRTWLAPTEAVAISQDLLVVSTPNPFAVDWVEDKYSELLSAIGERLFGRRFTLSVQFHSGGRTAQMPPSISVAPPTPAPAPAAAAAVAEPPADQLPTSQLNAKYIFPRFVVGNNNQLAAAAAHAVAEAPARMYNPLFIYGGVGQGKTHLMHAIGHALLGRTPNKRVLYISSEQFTNELVSAIQEGRMADFRRQYRQIDLLLVDDVQFLEGKKQTQEEFFHTFNALHDAQRQIVLTSDRPPKDIGVEDRLISRFEWGLVADIQPPDLETRMAILQKKVAEDQLELPDPEGVLGYIARNCTSSVREIEGALIKLLAYASLTRREINVQLAREALGGVLRSDSPGDSVPGGARSADAVRRRVAEAWGVTPEMLQSKKRTKDLTVPRQVAMYLIKEMLGSSLVEIGKAFGGRDHSTVIHSISKVEADMAADPGFRRRVEEIRATLG
ncbi:chromosomal replication initiator protein DnaA [soil metagenome]